MRTMTEGYVSSSAFDADMWADFQQGAVAQVEYDASNSETILGFLPEERMLLGLHEERAEVLSDDGPITLLEPVYRRFAALLKGASYVTSFSRDPAGAKQILHHQAEFGDSAWYLGNYTNTLGISMGEAVRDYAAAPFLCLPTSIRYPLAYPSELALFKSASSQLLAVGGEILHRGNPSMLDRDTRVVLTRAAGAYAVAMGLLMESTFGVELSEVMKRNHDKIDDRKVRGVLMVGHGDDR